MKESIVIREPQLEDAESIVSFYNFVGGETTFLSFEKDEYPLNVEEQREAISSINNHPALCSWQWMVGKLQELEPFTLGIK